MKSQLIFVLIFVCAAGFCADTPEQIEQYRYSMGLIQRELYEEAAKVLSRLLSEPQSFSQTDSAIFWLAECEFRQKKYVDSAGLYQKLLSEYPQSAYADRSAYGLGWSHANDNNPKSAAEAFARVSKNDIALWVESNIKRAQLIVRYNLGTEEGIRVYEELLKEPSLSPSQKYECSLQIGIGKFNQSIYRQALPQLYEAVKNAPEPKKQAVQFYIAESHFRLKSYKEASNEYAKTISLSPQTPIAQKSAYCLAWCFIKLGKPERAIELFEKQLEDAASVVRLGSLRNLVDLQVNLHKYEDAVNTIEKYFSILTDNEKPDMAYFKALSLSRIGEYEKSLKAFSDYIKAYPRHKKANEAHYQHGLVNIALGRFKQAIYDFEHVTAKAPRVEPANENIEQKILNQTVSGQINAKTELNGADSEQSMAEDPYGELREKAIYRIGECWFNLGNIKMAGDSFNKVIRQYPNGKAKYDALYQLGELAYLQNSFEEAIIAFEAIANSENALSAQALFRMGEVQMRAKSYKDAINTFNAYLNQYQGGKLREDAIFKIGLSWVELKDKGQALAAFSQLLNAKGYFRQEARFNIAEIARSLKNYSLAIQHYKAITAEEPKHPLASQARQAVGVSLYMLNDYKAAIDTFSLILKDFEPTNAVIPEAQLWLGKSLLASKDRENGILEVLKVPVLYPKSPLVSEAYLLAARAYKDFGDVEKAKKMYQGLLKSSPSSEQKSEANSFLKRK